MKWNHDYIKWFVDDELYHSFDVSQANDQDDDNENPFRKPMRLVINLALGGSWGKDLDTSALPMLFIY